MLYFTDNRNEGAVIENAMQVYTRGPYLWNQKMRDMVGKIIPLWVRVLTISQNWARFSKVPRTFRIRKAIRKTPTRLFCKAGPFICCKGNKNQNSRKVSWLETPSFWRYKDNYVTRSTPEKFRGFRKTGPWFAGPAMSVSVLSNVAKLTLLWKMSD